jgi:glyoxylase I family protein
MAEIQGYHHLSLSVTDLGRSVDWYRSALGLAVDAEIEGAGFRRTRLRSGGGLTLTLTAHDQQSADPFSERRAGMDHVAFRVGGLEDVRKLKRRFEELGVDHSEVKESASGGAMITLRDPDNIQIEVFGGPVDPALAAGRA